MGDRRWKMGGSVGRLRGRAVFYRRDAEGAEGWLFIYVYGYVYERLGRVTGNLKSGRWTSALCRPYRASCFIQQRPSPCAHGAGLRYFALLGRARFFMVSRALPLAEVFRPVGASALLYSFPRLRPWLRYFAPLGRARGFVNVKVNEAGGR